MERKRLSSCSRPALLLWGLFSLLLPAAAIWWALDGVLARNQLQQQQYVSSGFKFYGAFRLILQMSAEAALFLLLPCSSSRSKSSKSNKKNSRSSITDSSSGGQASAPMRRFLSYLFHLRCVTNCCSARGD